MQLVLMGLRNNKKAQQAQLSLITCYKVAFKVAFKVALALKQQVTSMIAKTKVQAHDAIEQMHVKESRKHKKAKAKLKFVDQKKEEEIDVHIDRILELERSAKSREKTMNAMRKKMKELETEFSEEKNNNLEKYEKSQKIKTKYMNRYRTAKTVLDTTIKEKDHALQRLERYAKKRTDSPSNEKYKKKVEKYKNIISDLEGKVVKYKKKESDMIKRNIQLVQLVKKLRDEIKALKTRSDEESSGEESSGEESSGEKSSGEESSGEKSAGENNDKVSVSKYTQKGLSIKSVMELKDLCRSKGIWGYSGKRKSDLIVFMLGNKKMV